MDVVDGSVVFVIEFLYVFKVEKGKGEALVIVEFRISFAGSTRDSFR